MREKWVSSAAKHLQRKLEVVPTFEERQVTEIPWGVRCDSVASPWGLETGELVACSNGDPLQGHFP